MEKRLKISILLIGVLELSILMCACHAPCDIRNIDAEIQEISISKFCLETDQKEYVLDGQYNEKMSIKDGVGRMTVPIDAVPSTRLFVLKI